MIERPNVPWLARCLESPAYLPVIVGFDTVDALNVTEHDALTASIITSVQLVATNVPEVVGVRAHDTAPVGVEAVNPSVSVTVAVHVVVFPAATGLGKHDTDVD